MKTLVIYYSYSGRTRTLAERLAAEQGVALAELCDKSRPGMVRVLIAGCVAAMRGRSWPILPLDVDLTECDRLMLLSPIWAGNTPPAVNEFLKLLPRGKEIAVKLVSDSGKSHCRSRLDAEIKARGCKLTGFTNIRTQDI